MLRKILLSSILILVVGCGGKSFKNGVYDGLIGKDPFKLIINNNKVEFIDIDLNNKKSYYSKVNNKNENDKDIIYYITTINELRGYLGLKQTNDNSIVVYNMPTVACHNSMLSYNAGFIDKEMLNSIIDIYSIDINKPSIFEKVEEK